MNFITASRNILTGVVKYYSGHSTDVGDGPDEWWSEYVQGSVLEVYIGTWGGGHRQVVLAIEHPPPGAYQETFDLVFRGPREQAIEIFEAHVGMLP